MIAKAIIYLRFILFIKISQSKDQKDQSSSIFIALSFCNRTYLMIQRFPERSMYDNHSIGCNSNTLLSHCLLPFHKNVCPLQVSSVRICSIYLQTNTLFEHCLSLTDAQFCTTVILLDYHPSFSLHSPFPTSSRSMPILVHNENYYFKKQLIMFYEIYFIKSYHL